jgi:hypothetical protein
MVRWEEGEVGRGGVERGGGEHRKVTHDHSDVLRGAWLDTALGLRRARFGPVRIV